MPHYPIYLESGPKRRKTMVHVLDLLGCVATGPSTEAALQATPDAIRAYLRFLRRHGEAADLDAPFTTPVAEHITEGQWLGNGSPHPGVWPGPLAVGFSGGGQAGLGGFQCRRDDRLGSGRARGGAESGV